MSNDYFKAQGWFKNYALNSQDSRGTFQQLVKEDEEAFRLASAESDRIKNMMNKKYGPGTMKYGSEISQPTTRPDVIEIDAINSFIRRNPAAEGGRQGYKNAKLVIQPPKMTEEKQKISSAPLKEDYLGQLKDKRKVRTSSLDDAIEVRNIIIKNKGHVGNIEELGRLANILVAGKSGKVDPRKTKLALDLALDSFEELEGFKLADAKYPKINTKKFRYLDMVAKSFANHNTAKNSLEASAHLLQDNMAKIVDMGGRETLEKGFFNLRGKITDADKKFISERVAVLTGKDFNIDSVNELIEETSKIRRSEGSIAAKLKRYAKQNEDIKNLYNDSTIQKLIKGNLDNKTRQKILDRAVDIVGDDVAIASRRLFMMAESMAGTRPIEGIVENKNLGNKLIDTQRIIGKNVKDGRAFSSLVYNHYAKTIDNALGTGPGKSFIGYYQQKIKNALDKGLVPDEIFSVTASARRGMHPYAIFTQALDADVNSSIKGANLDGLLSKTHRDLQEIFKGRTYDKLNTAEKKSVQGLVSTFENAKKNVLKDLKPEVRDTIQLAEFDLKNPPSKSIANYDSYDKNLQKAFDKSFKDTGYSMKVTADMKTQKELIKAIGCPNFKAAGGGRIGFAEGADCFDKGQKLINSGMKDASPASMRNFGKFANSALKLGRNVMKFGVIPEAIYIGAESLVRMGMGDTLSEASKQAVGFYLDPIFGTNFKKEGAFSKMAGDVGSEMAFDVSRLNDYNEALSKIEKLKNAKEQTLAVNDESLTGQTDQEVMAQYDKFIADAQTELNKRMLTETERVDFENKADTAADVAGVKSPIRQAIGQARADTEMMRYEDDFSGMQSDMFTLDPMSERAKKDRLSNLLPQKAMTPRLSKFVNFDDRQIEKLSGLTKKPVKELQNYQDYLNKERSLSLLEQEKIFGKEQTYGTQGNFFGEQINKKPMYDYAEGGITGLRSKYEYKK